MISLNETYNKRGRNSVKDGAPLGRLGKGSIYFQGDIEQAGTDYNRKAECEKTTTHRKCSSHVL